MKTYKTQIQLKQRLALYSNTLHFDRERKKKKKITHTVIIKIQRDSVIQVSSSNTSTEMAWITGISAVDSPA